MPDESSAWRACACIAPGDTRIQFSGRVDDRVPGAPVLVWPCSAIRFSVRGTHARVRLSTQRSYWNSDIGILYGDCQGRIHMPVQGECAVDLAPYLSASETREITLFKRMDPCHTLTFHGVELGDGTSLFRAPEPPARRMEVYGDSVSAGVASEAVAFTGLPDPPNMDEYSNSYYSYAWLAARRLGAQLNDIAIGGVSVEDGCGYFMGPNTRGMLTLFDKANPNPELSDLPLWNFARYRPHVVVVALGQNDAHPDDFMARQPHGARANEWRAHYMKLIGEIRSRYPSAHIVLATTVLTHAPEWDDAIEDIAQQLRGGDTRVHFLRYTRAGRGTPGHARIGEAEEMARELSKYIESLGEDVWRDEPQGTHPINY